MVIYFKSPNNGFFSPEATYAMGAAFDRTWKILQESGSHLAATVRADSTRAAIAKKIIELTLKGERDPVRLYEQALAMDTGPEVQPRVFRHSQ